jgi:hypothetical protein
MAAASAALDLCAMKIFARSVSSPPSASTPANSLVPRNASKPRAAYLGQAARITATPFFFDDCVVQMCVSFVQVESQ